MITADGRPLFLEDAKVASMHRTKEGFLVADVRAARTGIYIYGGSEVGRPELDRVRVYRPESTVFDKKTLASFTSLDITDGHPPEMVNAKNWSKYAKGNTSEEILRDGEFLRFNIIVKDEKTINKIEKDGIREVSLGYTCDLKFEPGETPNGEKYDAIQTSLSGNHLAIVPLGRAGSDCRIGDQNYEDEVMADNTRKILVDGYSVTVTDESERAILNLQQKMNDQGEQIKKLNSENLKLVADHGAELKTLNDKLSDQEKQLGAKDAEIKTLKDKLEDTASFDARVAERMEIVSKAKKLGLDDAACKLPNAQIVRAAVAKKLGDAAVKDKSDEYVRASFDFLSTQGGSTLSRDPVAEHMRDSRPHYSGPTTDADDREKAHKEMLDNLQNQWQNPFPQIPSTRQ